MYVDVVDDIIFDEGIKTGSSLNFFRDLSKSSTSLVVIFFFISFASFGIAMFICFLYTDIISDGSHDSS